MEVSGVTLRRLPCFSSTSGNHNHASASSRARPSICGARIVNSSDFWDKGHLQYYNYSQGEARSSLSSSSSRFKIKKEERESAKTKKKLKLFKGLSKDLSMFFQMDPDNTQAKRVAEAAQELIEELQELRAKEELKRSKKQEKAKLKAEARINSDCESSTSESSDSECDTNLRNGAGQPVLLELQQQPPQLEAAGHDISSRNHFRDKRIEVCMGNKCKKSGGAALLEAFETAVGLEGAVVGCKCMGKCRDGPNVRVNSAQDSVTTPPNPYPLCIGVGLEDVGVIVANFFEDKDKHFGLAPAS